MQFGVRIAGTGSYVPERVLTNHDLESMVDTTDEWIRSRTGIKERRVARDDQATSDLGAAAARRALEDAGLKPEELDLIVVATFTPDKIFPNTACFVQKLLGATNATCFAMEAACSGFVYGLEVVGALLRGGMHRNAVLIGAEKLSSLLNWEDRTTCVLFGDGAGAVVLEACPPEEDMLVSSELGADGTYTEILHVPAGGSREPFSPAVLDARTHYLAMSGQEVFKLAVNTMANAARAALAKAELTVDDVQWLVPHQANTRIINGVAKRLGVPRNRVFINLDRYGNTSAASIPIAWDELARQGGLRAGDHLLLVAFGGGLTWGANVVRWRG